MAYVFDPTTNTLIDDEDKSLGNKLALNDDEFQKLLDIPGVFRASEAPIPPPRQEVLDREAVNRFMRDNKAEGGSIRQNFVAAGLAVPFASALSYPASYGLATLFGLSTAGGAKVLGDRVTNHIKDNPEILNDPRFKAAALSFGINLPGYIAPDADEMERERKKIQDLEKERLKGTPPPKIETTETFPIEDKPVPRLPGFGEGEKIDIPTSTGGTIPIDQGPIIFEKKKYSEKALKELDPETLTDLNKIIKDYRDSKTRKKGPVTNIEGGRERVREKPASTQPIMNEGDKVELLNLVIDKYKEKENKLPDATQLKALLPSLQVSSLAKKNNIELGKRTADYDRNDPAYIATQRENKKLKANENSTITNFAGENFFPDNIKLKNGSTVNAKKFFINNLVKRTELGPSRTGTYDTTLKNKELAKLFNTNIRKIEEVIKNIKNSPDFTADYPEPRPVNYHQKKAEERITEARKYLTAAELANVKLQEKHLKYVNNLFKNGTLVVTDFPNLVEKINATMDKKTGKIDRSIKKTDKEMIERSKDNSGLFDISHTIPKSSEQQNIEFLRNRNFSDYKTNQGLFKSAEAYIKNETDDPEYDLRLEELDTYLKEMGQRVKIGNRFFGLDEAMIDSETGEFLGINKQLDYYGLPKIEKGVPLKKIKKASGGGVEITPLPRTNFGNGGAAGADENFATELEYFLTNEDAELPQLSTFKETKNPLEIINDIIDPRNYAYYANKIGARTVLRIAEFAGRIGPATGKLISDLIQKPAFKKIKDTDNNYVQDYMDELPPSNIKGTGIFSEFLENITPTSLEKKIGLDKTIEKQEQKQIDRGSTVGPKVFSDTISLGAEVTAPIFPGLKLLRAYAANRNLPVNDVTKKILVKEIDEVLETQGMNRREFLQATGAGATVILAKMLGFGNEVAKTAKVVEKAAAAPAGVPPYFFDLVEIIKKKGIDATKKSATQDLMNVYKYKGYEVYEDLATGQIRIEKGSSIRTDDDALQVLEYKPGQADETTKGKPADDYEEVTQVKYGDPTDIDVPIEEIEDGVDLDSILEFIKNEKVN